MRCHICDAPATCVGQYDNMEKPEPACDTCCGHGCEDGYCDPIDEVKVTVIEVFQSECACGVLVNETNGTRTKKNEPWKHIGCKESA